MVLHTAVMTSDVQAQPTCNDGNLVGEALRHAGHDGDLAQLLVHLRHQRPVLLVLHVVVHQRAPLALPVPSAVLGMSFTAVPAQRLQQLCSIHAVHMGLALSSCSTQLHAAWVLPMHGLWHVQRMHA
jgi:hypothetical protein